MDYSELATKSDLELLRRELTAHMDARFAAVDQRFAGMEQRFADVDRQFARVEQRLADMDRRFAAADLNRARDLRVMVSTQIGSMLGLAGLLLSFG